MSLWCSALVPVLQVLQELEQIVGFWKRDITSLLSRVFALIVSLMYTQLYFLIMLPANQVLPFLTDVPADLQEQDEQAGYCRFSLACSTNTNEGEIFHMREG